MRTARIERITNETQITAVLNLDGSGTNKIQTPLGFFNHMLEAFSRHGLFDLEISAQGDLEVDQHHLVEDCGIILGMAFKKALGDKKGINRAGYFVMPMDEALAIVAADLGGRPYLQFESDFHRRFCGDLDLDLLKDFFLGFANALQANMVVRIPFGRSDHHRVEATFKGFGKAMAMACSTNPRSKGQIPSTKGVIDDCNN